MHRRDGATDIVRLVRGERGRLVMRADLAMRFDYGRDVPWVSRIGDGRLRAIAGPDRLLLDTTAPIRGERMTTVSEFTVAAGETVPFVLTWPPSYQPLPAKLAAEAVLTAETEEWQAWSARGNVGGSTGGEWAEAVRRS